MAIAARSGPHGELRAHTSKHVVSLEDTRIKACADAFLELIRSFEIAPILPPIFSFFLSRISSVAMKFFAATFFALPLLASALPQPTPAAAALQARETPSPGECIAAAKYVGIHGPGVTLYEQSCNTLGIQCQRLSNSTTYIWHKSVCVAAATCQGTADTVTLAKCANSETAALDRMYDLSYNVRRVGFPFV
jgi:hypothetical protein